MPARFDPAAYAEAAHVTVDLLAEHVAASQRGEGAATVRPPMADIARDLDLARLLREGGLDAASWPEFLRAYLDRGVHLHHPGSLAHQVTVPDSPARSATSSTASSTTPWASRRWAPPRPPPRAWSSSGCSSAPASPAGRAC